MREQYLKNEEMDTRQQTYDSITKLLASLNDPFTRFLVPDRLSALRRGTIGGVKALNCLKTCSSQDICWKPPEFVPLA